MYQATESAIAEALHQATTEPTFAPLSQSQKDDIRRCLHEAALVHIAAIVNEAAQALKNPGSEVQKVSTRYLTRAIEMMKLASPPAMIDCFGIDAVAEAADRVAAMNWVLGLSTNTAVGLLNLGTDVHAVLIKKDGTAAGGKPTQLAEALDSSIYEITADAWLYTRGHEWAAPPTAPIATRQEHGLYETIH